MSTITGSVNTWETAERPWWRTFQRTLVVGGVVLACTLLFFSRGVLFYLFTGIVIATAVRSPIARLRARGLSHTTAATVVYSLVIAAALGVLTLPVPIVTGQVSRLWEALPTIYTSVRGQIIESAGPSLKRFVERTPDSFETLWAGEQKNEMVRSAAGMIDGDAILGGLFGVAAVLLLAFYWTLHEERTVRGLLLWVPARKRDSAREFIDAVLTKTGAFVRGQALLCLIVGGLNLIAYTIIGVPYPFALALLAGVLESVPVFGPLLGAVPAVLVASTLGLQPALWTAASAFVIQQMENHLLLPRVMSRSVGVNSLVTLLAMAAFTALFGFVGLILAIPLAACFQLVLDRFLLGREALQAELPEGRDRISRLRLEAAELAQDARQRFRRTETETADADAPPTDGRPWEEKIEALAVDLERVLAAEASSAAATYEAAAAADAGATNASGAPAVAAAAPLPSLEPARRESFYESLADKPLARLAVHTLIVTATLAGLALLWPLRGVLLLFLLSLALAAALSPLVDRLCRRGWPRGAALASAYVPTLVLFAATIALVFRPLSNEVRQLTDDTMAASESWQGAHLDGGILFRTLFVKPNPKRPGQTDSSPEMELTQSLFGATAGVLGVLVQAVVVIVISVYWMVDREYFERLWLSLLSPRRRTAAREAWEHSEHEVGAYFRSEVLQMFAATLLLALGYYTLGHPYPLLAAVCGGAMWLVPWAGVVFTIGAIAVLALPVVPAEGWQAYAWATAPAAVYAFAVLWWLEFIVEPRLFARRRYNTLGMAVVTLALAEAMGLSGLLLGPPLAIVAEILLGYGLRWSTAAAPATDARRLHSLSTQTTEMLEQLSQSPSPPQELVGLSERLKELVRQAGGASSAV